MSPHKRKNNLPPECTAPKRDARSLSFPAAAVPRPSGRKRIVQGSFATATAVAAVLALQRPALAGPTGGTVVQGSAGISQAGNTTNINQSTNRAIINWQGFSIGPQETVNFYQPSSSAVTLNRVIGNEQSVISGALNANGQVFIVNSAGVLFTKDSQVNVGGLVASSLDISNASFMAGNYVFSGSSTASVVNLGAIHAHDGGYVALLGKTVSNQGVISATLGTVAMASGQKVTLNFAGNSLIDVTIDEGVLNALVENKAAIKADGGRVILTAKAADAVLSAQVNNSGVIQARTMAALTGGSGTSGSGAARTGSIKLLASGGTVHVAGKLDASAPKGGKGGTIETSGNKVKIADGAVITTKAASGQNGAWTIDPDGFTIGTGGDMTGAQLTSELANGNVTIQSVSGGGTDGNINVNDPVSWAANTLTLIATDNIYVNNVMTATGSAGLTATYGSGVNADHTPMGLYTLQSAQLSPYSGGAFTGKINFSGSGAVELNGQTYTVINSAADLAAVTTGGNYVLGSDFGLPWNSLATIGSDAHPYTGAFNGFGHQLNIGVQNAGTGLFGTIGASGAVSNLSVNANLQPNANNHGADTTDPTVNLASLGVLADVNKGSILNSFAIGVLLAENEASNPKATIDNVGGLVGDNYGLIANSYSAVTVVGTLNIGGFVGVNEASGAIYSSAARFAYSSVSGTVDSIAYAGGFAGVNAGLISQSYVRSGVQLSGAAAASSSSSLAAGFVGKNTSTGTIDQAYVYYGNYDGSDGVAGAHVAGFVGDNAGTITNSYSAAFESTTGAPPYDSAFAYINSGTIASSYAVARSASSSSQQSYGFVAINNGGTTTNDYWYAPPQYNSSTPPMSDNSTATALTLAQSTALASYANFDPAIWGASSQGYPVLRQMPILATTVSTVAYGATGSDILASLKVAGLQYTDSASQLAVTTPSSGYLDAGSYAAGSVMTSRVYADILGSLTITPRSLTLANGVVSDKTYDGTAAGAVNNGLALGGLVGLVGDQTLAIQYLSAAFSDKNAAQNKTATVAFTVADGTNGGKASNYIVSDTATATIDPKTISAGFSAADKIYDGSAAATATTQLSGVVSGDAVALDYASALFSDKNAGQNKGVTLSGLTLTGSDQGNYALLATSLQSTATIFPRPLDLYGTEVAATTASFSAANLFAKNAVPGDVVGLTGTVTLAGTAAGVQFISNLNGASVNNANYTLVGATGSVLVGTASLALDKIVYGTVNIASSGTTTTVTESTNQAIIDWLRFSIASNETVSFVQPSPTSIVLNRVTGNERSVIDGALNANGRVFIVNSNGILFSGSSQVNVGALVATTLNIDNNNFENGDYQFAAAGGAGSITALGSINVADQGFAALASGGGVTFSGALSAPGGTAVLAAANNMNLTLDSATPGLTNYALGSLSGAAAVAGSLNVSAASGNGGLIETAGDTVVLGKALAMDTGTNGAWSYSQNGDISIGAKGPFSGQSVDDNLAIRNLSLNSYQGSISVNDAVTWSTDARLTLTAGKNININNSIAATGDHAGLTLAYGGFSETGAATAGSNYFIINLTIAKDLSIGVGPASVTLTGSNAGLSINGNAYTLIQNMAQLEALSVQIPGVTDYDTYGPAYTIPTGYYALGQDLTATQTYSGPVIQTFVGTLAGMGHKISNLTINDTVDNGGDGLIGTLTQTKTDWSNYQTVTGPAVVRDLGLTNLSITGQVGGFATSFSASGGLAGEADKGSLISNVYVKGSIVTAGAKDISSFAGDVGGLVGSNRGTIDNSHVDIAITIPGAASDIGGLVGFNVKTGLIKNSSAKGSIYVGGRAFADGGGVGSNQIGGLVGFNIGNIVNSHANVDIIANNSEQIGGLVGLNYSDGTSATANITNSSAGGTITSEWFSTMYGGSGIGGLVGDNSGGAISGSSSTVNISVKATYSNVDTGWATFNDVGGLVGTNEQAYNPSTGNFDYGASVTNSTYKGNITATGAVSGIGGVVGYNGGSVSGVQASGTITGSQGASTLGGTSDLGGLAGFNGGSLSNSSSSMNVNADYYVGGAVGSNSGTISNVSASGAATGIDYVGGFAGQNSGSIVDSKSSGNAKGRNDVGGFAGGNYSTDKNAPAIIKGSTSSGDANGNTDVGGFVGFNGGKLLSNTSIGNANGVKNVGGLIGQNGGRDQYGNVFDATVQGNTTIGNASGSINVGALIGLNNNGGAANVILDNNATYGAAFVDGKDTGALIGSDEGSTGNNNTYQDLPAQRAAAAKQAAQIAAAAAAAATVIATTDTAMTAESPPKASMSTGGTKAVYSAAAPRIEDNLDITAPAPAPPAATGPASERRTRRAAADTTSGSHRESHSGGGGGSGSGFGASIRSIEINGQHFDLEHKKSKDVSAPGDAR